MINNASPLNRNRLSRIFYGFALIFLFIRWKNNMLLSQLESPQLTYLGLDITYILFSYTHITTFLGQNKWASALIDIFLFLTAFVSFAIPRQRVTSLLFTLFLGIYTVVGYSFLCFHKHNLTGFWICSLAFWGITETGFLFSFNLVRFYCLYVYASAGFWKFFRGVWNSSNHFQGILRGDSLGYVVQHRDALLTKTIQWLISHPALLDKMMILSCFMQLLFFVGFITRKLDGVLLLYAIGFHLLSLLLLRASFIEFSIILITLIPLQFISKKKQST